MKYRHILRLRYCMRIVMFIFVTIIFLEATMDEGSFGTVDCE